MRRAVVITALLMLAANACQREERRFSLPEASQRPLTVEPASNFFAGEQPFVAADTLDPRMPGYAETAYAVSEGGTLYMAFNCVGCHANGGGAIGPPFIDKVWLYGSTPYAIAQSILGGRHNGMPSFRNKLAAPQLYYLVAYVRTLGGLVRGDAVPARGAARQYALGSRS
jgi:cytochrome c oxidase cbb3-type subunit III